MVVPSTAQAAAEHGGTEMQATQTRSQDRPNARRAAIAIALFVAAVLITLSTLYFAMGRTSSAVHTAPSRVQAVSGPAVGHSGVSADARDASVQHLPEGANAGASGLRQNGPLP
jgi:hypothetical protein